MIDDAAIGEAILRLAAQCGPHRSICPSDAARALAPTRTDDWQFLLPAVRRVAADLARAGRIDMLRKGRKVSPDGVKGVIRLRLAAPAPIG